MSTPPHEPGKPSDESGTPPEEPGIGPADMFKKSDKPAAETPESASEAPVSDTPSVSHTPPADDLTTRYTPDTPPSQPEPTQFNPAAAPPQYPAGGVYGYPPQGHQPPEGSYPPGGGYPSYPQGSQPPYPQQFGPGQQPYGQQPYGQQSYGQQPYGQSYQPYPGGANYGAPPHTGPQTFSIIGFVCAAIALIFCPPLFGIAGIVLGVIGHNKGEPLGKWAAVAAGVAMVLGIIIGVAIYGSGVMPNTR
ncbi:hypothetical protein [Nocardia aurantiaca]|uniref:DUF4190 domain-containing protein n=1 Tax=Nocardia aurantiaca TaxID=2675850 RepID=A0A6I3L110_9NOCA|nr:hypothetical protein [Nocardia aurantiaca]MTE15441.1 hypothetical protein [Nocardia aurantiaca]